MPLFKNWPRSIIGVIAPDTWNKERAKKGHVNRVRRERVIWNIVTLNFLKDQATEEGYIGREFYDKIARGKRHWEAMLNLFDDDDD